MQGYFKGVSQLTDKNFQVCVRKCTKFSVLTLTAEDNGNVIGGQVVLRLDAHEEGAAASRGDALPGEVLALQGDGKGAFL